MNEETAFLEAIKEKPDDLALRLVYADWLEERGDPRSEYLRVDGEFHEVIGAFEATRAADEPRMRKLRARLKELGETLDADWTAFFDALRPELCRCRVCRKVISSKEAIATDPRSYRKLKTSRYCKLCFEDAARSSMQRGLGSYERRGSAQRDYHGGGSDDD